MSIDAHKELVQLLVDEGLGRLAVLRKTQGVAKRNAAGEHDPDDISQYGGKPYKDWLVRIYRATAISAEAKDPMGRLQLQQEVIYIAIDKTATDSAGNVPVPSQNDAIVQLRHNPRTGQVIKPYLMAGAPVPIDSIIEYWDDVHGNTVFYVLKPSNPYQLNTPVR